jgi:rhamnosyltransferase
VVILDEYEKSGILSWYTGKNLRSAKSFMDLIMKAPETDYYAFCDQDDVWNNNKLDRAIAKLKEMGDESTPILYCSNYQLVDAELNNLPDNGHVSTTTFSEAIVSSCCTGCTVVFNQALIQYLKIGTPKVIVMHDDWVHKVCLAIGGIVYYDQMRTLKYRQHGNNVDGGVHSLSEKLKQTFRRISHKDYIRSKQLKEIIKIYQKVIPSENMCLLNNVAFYKENNLLCRMKIIFSKNIRTPYQRLNRGFRVAIIFKYF